MDAAGIFVSSFDSRIPPDVFVDLCLRGARIVDVTNSGETLMSPGVSEASMSSNASSGRRRFGGIMHPLMDFLENAHRGEPFFIVQVCCMRSGCKLQRMYCAVPRTLAALQTAFKYLPQTCYEAYWRATRPVFDVDMKRADMPNTLVIEHSDMLVFCGALSEHLRRFYGGSSVSFVLLESNSDTKISYHIIFRLFAAACEMIVENASILVFIGFVEKHFAPPLQSFIMKCVDRTIYGAAGRLFRFAGHHKLRANGSTGPALNWVWPRRSEGDLEHTLCVPVDRPLFHSSCVESGCDVWPPWRAERDPRKRSISRITQPPKPQPSKAQQIRVSFPLDLTMQGEKALCSMECAANFKHLTNWCDLMVFFVGTVMQIPGCILHEQRMLCENILLIRFVDDQCMIRSHATGVWGERHRSNRPYWLCTLKCEISSLTIVQRCLDEECVGKQGVFAKQIPEQFKAHAIVCFRSEHPKKI